MRYCPNKTKKTIFLSLPGLPAKKIGFIGTIQHFLPLGFKKCCTVPIKPTFLADALGRLDFVFWFYWDSTALFTKKIGFIGTVQHFLKPRGRKCCIVPIKPICLAGRPGRLKKIVFLVLLGQYSTFHQKDWFFGTVQHFLPLGFKKCCTVPIKPIVLADALGRLKKIVN